MNSHEVFVEIREIRVLPFEKGIKPMTLRKPWNISAFFCQGKVEMSPF